MSHIYIPQSATYLHGKPAPIRRKRQSFDFQALTSRNKANHGHRLSQQLPVPSDHLKGSSIDSPKTSVEFDAKETDAAIHLSFRKGLGDIGEKGSSKVSRHKATRSIEADDITGFWSRRLTAQKRTVAVKPPPAESPQSFRVRTFSSSAMLSTVPSLPSQSTSPSKVLSVTDLSSATSPPPLNRTLRRKPTMGPPPPPKDRHTLRTRASGSKGNVRPATSPQVSVPRKSRSAPLQNITSVPTLLPSQSGNLRPSSSSKDTLPFPSTHADGKDEKGRTAKLFPPITFSKIVSSITRRSPSAPTTPVAFSITPSTPSAGQERSASDTSLTQQSEKALQEKLDRDKRRKTGLEQIVVDAGRDKHTYTKESETEEVLRILEQLRKMRAA